MKFIFLFILSINIFASTFIEKGNKEIKYLLGNDVIYSMKKYKINRNIKMNIEKKVKQKFYKNWLYFWKIKDKKKNIYYSLIDNVMGKQFPITFIVIFDFRGNIIFSKILKYRNKKGKEHKKKSWLNQFVNKNGDSSFILDKDIDTISGATISSKSLTKGFQKLSILIKHIIKNKHK